MSIFLTCLGRGGYAVAQESLPPDFCRTVFHGEIGPNADIQIILTRNGKDLSGTYVYATYHIPIRLSGIVESDGLFTMTEYPKGNVSTGTFTGRFLSPEEIEGIWSSHDDTRKYPFSAKRQRGIEHQIALPEKAPFQIIRKPITVKKDVLLLVLKEHNEIPFYEESGYAYLDAGSVHIQLLSEEFRLWAIEWQTEPEGQGHYTAHYYMLFLEGGEEPLVVKGWVSSGRSGACMWGRGVPLIEYKNHQLRITETYEYHECHGESMQPFLQETQTERIYSVTKTGIHLVHAEKRQKEAVGNSEQGDSLEMVLENTKWEIQKLPLERAMKEFPAIKEKDWY